MICVFLLRYCLGKEYPTWIIPCLFYIQVRLSHWCGLVYICTIISIPQVLPYITEHFSEGFGLFRPYVSDLIESLCMQMYNFNFFLSFQLYYIGSALSFYLPYDFCLYSNMSALVSYTLRFIPAVVVSVTILTYLTIMYALHLSYVHV